MDVDAYRPPISGMAGHRFCFDYSRSTVRIYRDQVLGMGSFGTVCKAKCDDFICAAKSLHSLLTGPNHGDGEAADVAKRFQQECDFLCALRHPNIVQYLGVYQDPDSRTQVLLMELMNDENLTQFLHNSPSLLPFHLEVNICHDIAQALTYLHPNKVIHRDLSGSNVLLIGNALKAKVCDFGTAKLLDINPSYRQVLTMCPGNLAYMPPEALRENPKYDEKLDCFSFGVLIVQVLTRLFPQPGDHNEAIQDHPYGSTSIRLISEVERRRNHISLIDPHHPLLQTALKCLKDEGFERPSALWLSENIGPLKESHLYGETSRQPKPEPRVPTERHERHHETQDSWKEVLKLRELIKQKDSLIEDVLMNASIQEKFLAEKQAKLDEEKKISVQLRQQVSQSQAEMQQLQRELAHSRRLSEELNQKYQLEQQQRHQSHGEIDRLRKESVQAGEYITILQQQVREEQRKVEQSQWKYHQELTWARDEISELKHQLHENQLRVTRETDELNSRLLEVSRERDNLNAQLREASRESSQLRDEVSEVSREKTAVSGERDRLSDVIRERDSRIQELERRLAEDRPRTQIHHLPLGDTWNVPRGDVELHHDKEIGRGASGLVLEGRYQNQQVAVKQIHQDILTNRTVMNEFRREVRIMASIQHPNLVRFIAAVFDDRAEQLLESPLLVLELLHTNLRKAYQRGDHNIQKHRVSIFRDMAYGLHYLHEHQEPIIHRDVSAPNVLLESSRVPGGAFTWKAKLSDFGSANFLRRAETLGVGAIVYTAPEMFPREEPSAPMPRSTTKSDVFSYGIVLVEVITKTMPTQENRHQLFDEVKTKWLEMYNLISRCTETSPDARPNMSDILNTLNRIPTARPRIQSVPT